MFYIQSHFTDSRLNTSYKLYLDWDFLRPKSLIVMAKTGGHDLAKSV